MDLGDITKAVLSAFPTRALVLAVWFASSVLLFGPHLAPDVSAPYLGDYWKPDSEGGRALLPAFLVTSFLTGIIFWQWAGWRAMHPKRWRFRLNERENFILFILTIDGGDQPTGIDQLMQFQKYTRLDLLHAAETLREKGIVHLNEYDPLLITLTEKGRAFAIKHRETMRLVIENTKDLK